LTETPPGLVVFNTFSMTYQRLKICWQFGTLPAIITYSFDGFVDRLTLNLHGNPSGMLSTTKLKDTQPYGTGNIRSY